jgi:hypothetical protein
MQTSIKTVRTCGNPYYDSWDEAHETSESLPRDFEGMGVTSPTCMMGEREGGSLSELGNLAKATVHLFVFGSRWVVPSSKPCGSSVGL